MTLLGGRGRTTDIPWAAKIGNIELRNFLDPAQELTSTNQIYMTQISSPELQTEIILKIIIPLAIFSIVHLIGSIRWIKHHALNNSPKSFFIYPYSITIMPILFFPYMRYFYPLIPFAIIGLCMSKAKTQST